MRPELVAASGLDDATAGLESPEDGASRLLRGLRGSFTGTDEPAPTGQETADLERLVNPDDATTAPGSPILFRREPDVGHGARAVSKSVELSADVLAFAAARTGLDLDGTAALAR